jgi:uncharacterized protein YlxW (UPF0749 family)
MGLFYQQAFWGFLALVAALIAVVYNLFKNGLGKDLLIQKNSIKEELRVEFSAEVKSLKTEIANLSKELESFKRHEDNNARMQIDLTKKLIKRLDILDKIDPKILIEILEESD